MSLLKKASIITTPTAYAEDYLYSIKPAYALGQELVTNGTFDTDSNWTKGSGWTISGGKANRSGESGNSFISQDINVISGRNYIVKYDRTYVSGDGQTNLFSYFEGNSSRTTRGNYEDTTVETVTVTDYFKPTYTGNLSLRVYGISDFTGSVDNVSIKEITDADFDFDRNSTGTRVNEDYLIEDVPYNLITRSEDFSHGAYTKYQASIAETTIQSPISGSYVESISNTNTGTTYSFISQNLVAPDREVNSTLSVYAKKGTYNRLGISSRASGNTFGVLFDLDSGTVVDTSSGSTQILGSSIQSAGNNFYLCSVTLEKVTQFNIHPIPNNISNAGLLLSTLSYTETGNVNVFGAQAVKGSKLKPYLKTTDRLDIPRIDYTNGEPSILLEPSRTNSVTYSNDFSNSDWIKQSGISSTYNTTETLSPEGLNNASKFTGNGTNGVYRQVIVTGVVARSIYLKSVTGNVSVTIKDPVLTVTTKTLNLNETWQRFELIESNGHGSLSGIWINDIPASGIYMYGAQVEAGSYATSLIHTSGSAVTRSGDAANNAGNSDLINSTEGVLYAEIKALADDGTNRRLSLSDGSDTNRINLMYTATNNQIVINYRVAGTTQVSLNKVFEDVTEFHKVALRWQSGNFSYYADGQEISTDSNTTMISANTLNTLRLEDPTGANDMYANVKSVMVFKEALTDLELEKLTGYNNHELYMNYYNRLSYLGLAEEYNVESDINNYIL